MDSTLDIKQSRRHVGGAGVSAMKTGARRRNRHVNNSRLKTMGEDYTPDFKKLTGWDVS